MREGREEVVEREEVEDEEEEDEDDSDEWVVILLPVLIPS